MGLGFRVLGFRVLGFSDLWVAVQGWLCHDGLESQTLTLALT